MLFFIFMSKTSVLFEICTEVYLNVVYVNVIMTYICLVKGFMIDVSLVQ